MAKKWVKYGFYRLEVKTSSKQKGDKKATQKTEEFSLSDWNKITCEIKKEDREIIINKTKDIRVRLESSIEKGVYHAMQFMRMDPTQAGYLAKQGEDAKPIEYGIDEYYGLDTNILYHPKLCIAMVQLSRGGPNLRELEKYFKKLNHCEDTVKSVEFIPIEKKDEINPEDFFKEAEIKIALDGSFTELIDNVSQKKKSVFERQGKHDDIEAETNSAKMGIVSIKYKSVDGVSIKGEELQEILGEYCDDDSLQSFKATVKRESEHEFAMNLLEETLFVEYINFVLSPNVRVIGFQLMYLTMIKRFDLVLDKFI